MKIILISVFTLLISCHTLSAEDKSSIEKTLSKFQTICAFFPKHCDWELDIKRDSANNQLSVKAVFDGNRPISNEIEKSPLKMGNCDECQVVINAYELVVDRYLRPEQIQRHLLEVCLIYNEPLKKQCTDFYNGVGFEVIKAILRNEDPERVCRSFQLCKESNHRAIINLLSKYPVKSKSDKCTDCINEVETNEKNINKSRTPIEVQVASLGYCHIFNEPTKDICIQYYLTTGLVVIKDILNGKDPKEICQYVKACPSTSIKMKSLYTKNVTVNSKSEVQDRACNICKYVMKWYEQVIDHSLSPEDVQKYIINVCGIYKEPLKDQCIAFYKGAGFDIIKAILKNQDPKQLCQSLKLCDKFNSNSKHRVFIGYN